MDPFERKMLRRRQWQIRVLLLLPVLIAVAILTGELVPILKLLLIFVFMCLTGPVVTHLIAGAEVETHENAGHEYREVDRR